MKSHNWPYMAGIIDGEGCFHIARIRSYQDEQTGSYQIGYRLDIHVTTTSQALAKYLVANFGGKYYMCPSGNALWKDAFRWQPSGKKNKERLILGVLPYLVIKRDLAEICLQFLRLGNSNDPIRREELCQQARELSRRGRSVETDMFGPGETGVIQSDLQGDLQSAPVETQVA
jgi:hypothetical protein